MNLITSNYKITKYNSKMSIETISLSGRKKMVSNKEMTFLERMYLVAIVKGLFITLKHLFRKKVTIHYPEQVRTMSPVYRGQHMLKRDEQGRENCTACGLCALSCPAEAITMKAAERKPDEKHLYREEKYAEIYEINMLRCIFCGLCEEACPKDAIYLTTSKVLVPASYEREDFIFGKDKLVMPLEMAMKNAQLKNAN
ncbi:NADH-quinone oxidoreductase subunit I [Flavobacterium sp. SORGH_AS 622]|nr:NADH-quinone oxidoreductase subunit I [Flavobacterium sp. SORGH_AS_0622]